MMQLIDECSLFSMAADAAWIGQRRLVCKRVICLEATGSELLKDSQTLCAN